MINPWLALFFPELREAEAPAQTPNEGESLVTPADDAPAAAPEQGAKTRARRSKAQDDLAAALVRLAEAQQDQFAALRDQMERFDARMAAMETVVQAGLAARPLAREGAAPLFEAQKAGFEHLLTGFRLALREIAGLPAQVERMEQSLQANAAAVQKLTEQVEVLAAAPRSSTPAARFEAEKVGFERILTGFRLVLRDLGQQVAGASPAVPPAAEAGLPAAIDFGPIETRLDAIMARLQAVEDILAQRSPSDPTRVSARFEAEKVGFERILTGFRLVLRDLGQQAAKGAAPPTGTEAEPLVLDLGPVEARLDAVMARLQRMEEVLAQRSPSDPTRVSARFEAEKVGFERILTGFRLVLRDLGQQVAKGVASPAKEAAPPAETEAEPLVLNLGPVEARLDAVMARLQTMEEVLAQRSPSDPTRVSARFEAEKVGFERILTGFRLVLRDLGQQVAQESAAPAAPTQAEPFVLDLGSVEARLDAVMARLQALEDVLAQRPPSDPSRVSARFEAEKVGFERLLEGFRMVLRDFGQQARNAGAETVLARLDALARRLESAEPPQPAPLPAATADLPLFDPRKLEFAQLRAGLVLVMRQVEQAAKRLDDVVARLGAAEAELKPAPITAEALVNADNAVEPATLSLQRLLGGYRFILVALQREAERLQATTGRAPDLLACSARIEAAVARLEALAPASPDAALDEAVHRLRALGLRMAGALDAQARGAGEDLRGQTAELLAIGEALAEEMRRRA